MYNKSVPHKRGDEPETGEIKRICVCVFPTSVGMNRWADTACGFRWSVPHKRGDEPFELMISNAGQVCSPQAWG